MTPEEAPHAQHKSTIVSAAFLGILSTGINGVAALVRSKAAALTIGVAGVGLIAELQQLLTLLSVPAMALTGAALTRRLVGARETGGLHEFREQTRSSATTTLVFTMTAAVLATVVAPFALSLPAEQFVSTVAIAGAAAVATAVLGVYAQALLVHGNIPRAYLATSLNSLLGAALAVVGLIAFGINGLFLGLLLAALTAGPTAALFAKNSIAPGSWAPSLKLSSHEDMRGGLVVSEFAKDLPFDVKRMFWVHSVPSEKVRGEHAHRACHQALFCIKGSVRALADDGNQRQDFLLDQPHLGLYLPPMTWGTQYAYSPDSILLVLASHTYDAADYFREYDRFLAEARRDG